MRNNPEPQDIDKIAAELAKTVAQELLETARRGGTEADFRREAALILDRAGSAAGLTVVPRDEFTVACGRVDSLYNRLVLEYKKPGVLAASNSNKANIAVIQQLKDYIRDVAKRERREAHRLAGVATDGFFYIFLRQVGEGWSVDDPVPVNHASTEGFLRLLFSLCTGAALVPENLVEDFGPKTLRAQRAVRALHKALETSTDPLVKKLFEQWKLFYSEATDYASWAERIESKEEFRSFVRGMGIDTKKADAATVFYAVHTYYALLIKLVAWLAAARFGGDESTPKALKQLASKTGNDLRLAFTNLERGGIFRDYGIRNFLEGDFFRWYISAWNEDIETEVGRMAQRLAEYDPGTLELAPENARDLLKKLYHGLLPREIRHDLGEYYTPDWLAERLIRQTLGTADLGNANKRVLDPACGSGTFLVILIKHIKERAERYKKSSSETLELILRNVIGIDLNPLAVIAARTNYLLALGDLLKARKDEIDIPVYQADSVLTPSRGTDLFEGNVYPLKTSAAVFRVPAVFAQRERVDALANTLDECVEAGVSETTFLQRAKNTAGLDDQETDAVSTDTKALYRQVRELHEHGLNGVWARIIKNNFAPLFLEPCHYIVGNPPWVNWESLPDEYRSDTMRLWQHYGLFPHGGMDTILGKGKKDISMLMTFVAVDRYLLRGGKLGFVLSQSLFKTAGAGQGFRRFTLPDKTPFGPLVVEDMVELQPFEGASNRTAVAVFGKNSAVRYPVVYQYWRKKQDGRGSSIGFDTPYEEVTSEKITFASLYAEPSDPKDLTSPWMVARTRSLKALRRIQGKCALDPHEGANTGGANGVYWVDVVGRRPNGLVIISNIPEGAKKKVPKTQAVVEETLVFPLLRGRDIDKWSATPSAHILMAQDPKTRSGIKSDEMERDYPKLHAYFSRFEELLRSRSAYRRYYSDSAPLWTMFDVGTYTFARYKCVWRGQVAPNLIAAVTSSPRGKPIVPDQTAYFVACASEDEAHYLCALLNSSLIRGYYKAHGYKHVSMDFVKGLAIPPYDQSRIARTLVELSRDAHEATSQQDHGALSGVEEQIDKEVAGLWGLDADEVSDIKRFLREFE